MNTNDTAWQPKFTLDLATAKGRAFDELVEKLSEWAKANPDPNPMPATGWHTITPEIAENLLRRNPHGANRRAVLPTVLYYADQMKAGEWPKTGQPIILSAAGRLIDAQHRLWACYLSGASFDSFVVSDVPDYPNLFAYIDNSKPRTATAAVQTAGLNGAAALAVSVTKIDYAYEHGLFSASSVSRQPRMAPIYYVRAIEQRPALRDASRRAISDYQSASNLIGSDVVAFATLKITEVHGDDTADQFMAELGGVDEVNDTSPVHALIKLIEKDARKAKDQMKTHQKLANLILAFNAWVQNQPLKNRWALQVSEPFPHFAPATEMAEAAE